MYQARRFPNRNNGNRPLSSSSLRNPNQVQAPLQTRPAPIPIVPDYEENQLSKTTISNAHGKRETVVSNGWSKECSLVSLLQFQSVAQALQLTTREKLINIQFVLNFSQRHIYTTTITDLGINVNAANPPAQRFTDLFNGIIALIFGPNDRHLEVQYLRYGVVFPQDKPLRYLYGRFRSLIDMTDYMPGNDPLPTHANMIDTIFNAQPEAARANFLRDHPSPHDVPHETLLSFLERQDPMSVYQQPVPASIPNEQSLQPRREQHHANRQRAEADGPSCPFHPHGFHDFADCKLNPHSDNYDAAFVQQLRSKRNRSSDIRASANHSNADSKQSHTSKSGNAHLALDSNYGTSYH